MQRCEDKRVDLGELKALIVKKIGVERSRKYFHYLSRFLSHKLTKTEFDKTCFRLLGKENLSLHNHLIRSVLRNATVSKSPPPRPCREAKHVDNGRRDGHEQCGSLIPNSNQNGPILSNGVLSISPQKVRSGIRDRKIRDRPSSHMLHQAACREDNRGSVVVENGYSGPSMRDDENQEEKARLNIMKSPLIAPLGISIGGSHRTVPISTSAGLSSCYDSGGVPDHEMLRKRMENIAVAQGLGGVSMECASTLNNMLDLYLKKLIKSCNDVVGDRSTNDRDLGKQSLDKNKIVNGVWPSNNSLQIQTHDRVSDVTEDRPSVSVLDFRTAMELNPQQLGKNWPTLRERISVRSFEEPEFDV
ncbi:unnamed protein product [Cochlearia groenlandica]